jgi:hypothetical protein
VEHQRGRRDLDVARRLERGEDTGCDAVREAVLVFLVSFMTSSFSSTSSSPFTEDALEAACDDSFDVGVFLTLPSAARFASRAALDAETMVGVVRGRRRVVSRGKKFRSGSSTSGLPR